MDATKTVFTTGDVARMCKISQQTVIRCFDKGQLGGYRVPGSRFRRITRDALVKFVKDFKLPMPEELICTQNVPSEETFRT